MLTTALILAAPLLGESGLVQEQKLLASNGQAFDNFGRDVAVHAGTALVGAPKDNFPAGEQGEVYVFVRDNLSWTEQARLSSPLASTGFPIHLAVHGDTAVATLIDVHGGAAIVYVRSGSTWSVQATLVPNDALDGMNFGWNVALDGDTIAVGAPHLGTGQPGAAYVFVRSGTVWAQQAKLQGSGGENADWFGARVALDGDLLAIGAEEDDHSGVTDAGAVYSFERSGTTWTETGYLTTSDPSPNGRVGESVAVSGQTIAAGSEVGPGAGGAAYVFERNGTSFAQSTKITSSASTFGLTIALHGDQLVVGAPSQAYSRAAFLPNAGAAYVYARSGTTWPFVEQLLPSDLESNKRFGVALSMDASGLLLGAWGDSTQGTSAGSAYFFRAPIAPTPYCTAGVSASGCSATLSSSGTPSASAASGFVVSAANVEGSKDGLFFYGTNGRQANPWGSGTSYQCVVPPTRRAQLQSGTGTNGNCDGAFSEDLNARWQAVPAHNPGAGAVVNVQLWYRDPNAPGNQTTSLSDGLEFSVCP